VKSLSKAMYKMIDLDMSEYAEMSKFSRLYVEKNFDEKIVVKMTLDGSSKLKVPEYENH
jgi:hypothetical protein